MEAYERRERQYNVNVLRGMYYDLYDSEIATGRAVEPDLDKWLTGGRTKGSVDVERRRGRGWEQVAGYLEYAQTAPEQILWLDPETPAVELEFTLDLAGITVRGCVDQVLIWPDGQITVRDLKTGSKLPDWDIQNGVYGLALTELLNTPVQWGDFYMAKNNAPTKMAPLERFTRDYLTRLFHDMHTAEVQGIYLPNPGDACRTCGVSQFCTAMGNRGNEYPIGVDNREP